MEKYSSYSLYLTSFIQHDLKIHVAVCFHSLFLCTAQQDSTYWIHHILSIYQLMDILDYFQVLAIVIKGTMNISA